MAQTIYLANMQVRKSAIRVSKKRCAGPCGEVKPIEAFGKETAAPDGHKTECRSCLNKKQNARNAEKKAYRSLFSV